MYTDQVHPIQKVQSQRDRRLHGVDEGNVARQQWTVVSRMTLEIKKECVKAEAMLKCWKLKKEECCREFRGESRQPLGSREELPECWKSTDEVKCQDFLSGVWQRKVLIWRCLEAGH